MTDFQEFTFLSSDGHTQLHGAQWATADREPIAVLQIAHGVAEHILRYDGFARYLNEQGILVAGHDHLGHGKSLPEGAVPVYFGDGATWETVVDDIHLLHQRLREQYPRLPILLMGHSMGSFLSRTYLIRYPGTVAGAILMGTGQMPPAVVAAAPTRCWDRRGGMKISTRQVAMCAMLTALALGLSTLENLFPVTLFIPLPGVKLGLANIVTVFALYQLGAAPALCILVARCLLGSLFAGNASALLFSLLGGVLAMLVMMALTRLRGLSVYGVSIGGAAAHNIGQMAAALITLGNTAVLGYLPFLLAVSLFTGALTGFVSALLLRAMSHVKLSHGRSADNG